LAWRKARLISGALNHKHGQTIIMATHDPHASHRATRTLYLNQGQLADRMMD
jgi:ABC-type lipoprotein export system ATPase subunit